MAKFAVGEVCLYVGTSGVTNNPAVDKYLNSECVVTALDPLLRPGHGDGTEKYAVQFRDGTTFAVRESSLRKKPPKDEPADGDFTEWFMGTIINKKVVNKRQKTPAGVEENENGVWPERECTHCYGSTL
jgi:hypothetical protein